MGKCVVHCGAPKDAHRSRIPKPEPIKSDKSVIFFQ